MAEENYLIDFYGTECSHCKEMEPLVEQLESELGVTVSRLEVWHNEDNAKKMRELAEGKCNSIPFFYNTKSGKYLCGSADYEKLKAWATSEA